MQFLLISWRFLQDDSDQGFYFAGRSCKAISVNKLFILGIMADNEVTEEGATERSTSVTILVENENPFFSDVLEEKSSSSSIPCSAQTSLSNLRTGEKFRTLKRRSSVENFGQFGFLVPALALFPQADGVSFV